MQEPGSMAKINPDELWSLIVETGLVARPAAARLRAEHDAGPAASVADAKAVAAWLVDKGVLTPWQARRLATGDRGPFFQGDYRLLARHDHDGDAFEFTARHEPSGRVVAIVLMSKKRWHEAATRDAIVRRMTIATQVTDPLFVRTWALEEAEGRPFAVCEEVRGDSLAEELARRGPATHREAGEIVLAVARAVAELHAAGEVHGGLSLDAIVRDPAAGAGWRLRQFPLATDPHQVPPRALVANEKELLFLGRRAAFVAPELATGAPCDARSDVYALGCILHALVTGSAPNWHGDARETLDRAAAAGPGPLDPQVAPAPLAALVDYMTARDPRDRYPDAAEAAGAIATTFGFPRPEPPAPRPAADAGQGVRPFAAPSDPQAARAAATEAVRRRAERLRVGATALAAAVVVAVAVIVVAKTMPAPRPRPQPDREVARTTAERPGAAANRLAPVAVDPPPAPESEPAPPAPPEPAGPTIVDDPGLPWAPPTAGPPPTLEYLPAGSQLVVVTRPADMLGDDEGRLLVKALGPDVEAALAAVAAACGCAPEEIETIQAGWQAEGTDALVVGWMARLVEGTTLPQDDTFRERAWGAATPAGRDGETMYKGRALSYWAPTKAAGRVLVAAPTKSLEEIVAASAVADPPVLVLPSDMERLVGVLHGARHLTVLGSPAYLLNSGRAILAGPLEPLAAEIEALLGESVQAAAVSVHCGTDFYAELDAVPAIDVPPAAFVPRLVERIRGYPTAVRDFIAARSLDPYGRALVIELPTMIRALVAHVRAGPEGKVAVVNAYLPRHAGHNVALAAELALAQASAGGDATPTPQAAGAAAPAQDALGRLGQKMTLVFAKDTLEKSIQMISDEIGVPMEILGNDLKLEGITQNQSFTLEEHDKPAGEILRTILARSNPDGKLVYVVRKKNGVESIEITTRAAAAERRDTLPTQFQDAGVQPKKDAK